MKVWNLRISKSTRIIYNKMLDYKNNPNNSNICNNQNNNQKNVQKMPYVQPVIGQGSPDPKTKSFFQDKVPQFGGVGQKRPGEQLA